MEHPAFTFTSGISSRVSNAQVHKVKNKILDAINNKGTIIEFNCNEGM